MLELIEKGGVMMYPILLSSLLALAVTLDRLYFFRIEYAPLEKNTVHHLFELLKKRNDFEAKKLISGLKTSIRNYYLFILFEHNSVERVHTAEMAGDEILHNLNRRLHLLAVIGSVTPLMGLLGTVIGMIKLFSRVAHVGRVTDISILAGGIWEALITTAAGMMVAIPVIIIHNYFQRCLNNSAHQMRQNGERIIKLLSCQEAML